MPTISLLNKISIYTAFCLSCVRIWLGDLDANTTILTASINIFILLGIAEKTNKYVLFGIIYSAFVFIFFSHSILLIYNIFLLSYELRIIPVQRLAIINLLLSLLFLGCIIEGVGLELLRYEIAKSHKGGNVVLYGFNNPNSFALFLTNIVLMLTLLIHKGKRFIFPLLIFVSSFIIQDITKSRTAQMSLICCSIMYFIYGNNIAGRKVVRFISLFPIFITFLLLSLLLLYKSIPGLDLFASGRLHIFNYWYDQCGLIQYMFGINLDDATALDGSYYLFILYGGIPSLFIFLYCFQKNLWNYFSYYLKYTPFIVGMLIYAITESNLVGLSGASLIFWRLTVFNKSFVEANKISAYVYENRFCLK